jgi:hypothetical protein
VVLRGWGWLRDWLVCWWLWSVAAQEAENARRREGQHASLELGAKLSRKAKRASQRVVAREHQAAEEQRAAEAAAKEGE